MDDKARLPPPAGAIRRTSASLPILIDRISKTPPILTPCYPAARSRWFWVAFRQRAYSLIGSASPADRSCYVGKPHSLGPDHPRLGRCAGDDLDRNAMDVLAARFSAAARAALVRTGAGHAGLLPAGVLLVVVCLRRVCALGVHRRRLYRSIGGIHRRRARHHLVDLKGARGEERRDLWLGALGHQGGNPRGLLARSGRCHPRLPCPALSAP